jgi:hypothetical protein
MRVRGVKREFFGPVVVLGTGRMCGRRIGKPQMNHFDELRSVLIELKTLERESVDADVIRLIDDAIDLLELTTQDIDNAEHLNNLMNVIGRIVLRLPALAAFIEALFNSD